MDALLRESRFMILASRIGLISLAQLIAWADDKILYINSPPSFLIDLALGEIPDHPCELDFVRNEAEEMEISRLARLVLEKLDRTGDLSGLGDHCYQLALIAKGRSRELLHWVSDEIFLCNEGYKSLLDSEPLIVSAVNEVAETGA